MDFVDGPVPLGEWMPDAQDLKFPNLIEARNVEPVGTVYKSFDALNSTGFVVPGGFVRGSGQAQIGGSSYYYVYTDDGIFESLGSTFNARSATFLSVQADFLQFDDIEIATVGLGASPLYHTIGAASNFATLGSASGNAPPSMRVGRINKFVFLGNTSTDSTRIVWSGLDNPLSYPTPNSATAIAQQSGEQYMDARLGEVTGFANGDQFGLVFQESGITRLTYVGPPVVFQFDKISDKVGCKFPRSIVQVGNITYFVGTDGFYKTDGVTLQNIGYNKVNRYFLEDFTGAKERVLGAVNTYKNLIYWAYCNTSDNESLPNEIAIFNYAENRFSYASQNLECMFSTNGTELTTSGQQIRALGADNTLGSFSDTVFPDSSVRVETGYAEMNPGGFTRLQGAKFLVDLSSTARASQCLYSNEIDVFSAATATSLVTANASTGFSDFNVEARYHSIAFVATSAFDQLSAIEFKAKKSGSR